MYVCMCVLSVCVYVCVYVCLCVCVCVCLRRMYVYTCALCVQLCRVYARDYMCMSLGFKYDACYMCMPMCGVCECPSLLAPSTSSPSLYCMLWKADITHYDIFLK